MRSRALSLVLIVMMPLLAACVGTSAADGPAAPGSGTQAAEIVGYQVYSPDGKWLGKVARVLLHRETGEVDYVVLAYREPRVYGRAVMVTDPQRYVPIPWARFAPRPGKDSITLNADEMLLIPAPYLDRAPDSLAAEHAEAVDNYWRSLDR